MTPATPSKSVPAWQCSRVCLTISDYEAAATIAGFAFNPITAAWYGEITTVIAHLRDVHGDQTYEALAHIGEAMTTTEIAAYAYDQIDQARAELDAVSK